jgi:hypothetical protein
MSADIGQRLRGGQAPAELIGNAGKVLHTNPDVQRERQADSFLQA